MSSKPHHIPPKWPFRILKHFLKPDYLEELEGDLEELYQENLELFSVRKARLKYIADALKLLRPALIKGAGLPLILRQNFMIRNNIKIAFRFFQREKTYSFINVAGLTTALAIALLIFQYVQFEFSYEKYNPNAERLIRLTQDNMNGNTVVDQDCETNPPLGPLLKSELPEVTEYTRAYHIDQHYLKIGEDIYREPRTYAVDPSFFKLFHYPLVHGNADEIFQKPHEVVLTESTALKYFNDTDVAGKTIYFTQIEKDFLIVGIVPDSPPNTHLKFDVLISYPTMTASLNEMDDNWSGNNTYTYILLDEKENYARFQANLEVMNRRLKEEKKFEDEKVASEPVGAIHLHSNKGFEPESTGNFISVIFLLGVALLVIIIAIVNYINLSTSKSLDRAKEVGVRKIVGSSLSQLRAQFYTESLLINMISGFGALLLIVFFLDHFRGIAQLPDSFNPLSNENFWFSLAAVLLLCTLLSGAFPAFILSSIKPASVLKGKFSHNKIGVLMRKGLVVFQFLITLFLIIQTLTAHEQLNYMRKQDIGLNTEQKVVLSLPGGDYKSLKEELLSHSGIKAVGGSSMVPGQSFSYLSTTTGIQLEEAVNEDNNNFNLIWIDSDFIPTLDIEVIAGDNFSPEAGSIDQVIVNEKSLHLWGVYDVSSVIGKKINLWGRQSTIIGVVNNFHLNSVKSPHLPVLLFPTKTHYKFFTISLSPGDLQDQLATIKAIHKKTVPEVPFEYFFLDQEFEKQYTADLQFQQVFGILTVFALLIACLGLYGLAAFTISRRSKEIGIRKVLGANVPQVIILLSRDFLKLVFIAIFISLPITYIFLDTWLMQFASRIDLDIWLFVLPSLLLICIAFFTVFIKTYKTSNLNPVDSLKAE